MGQPVKLSDELVLDARLTGEIVERSLAGQIEYWASLGRTVETVMRLPEILALRKAGAGKPLSECLADAGTLEGNRRVADYLKTRPFPHYETDPESPGLLVRIDVNGIRTRGRFINRRFVEKNANA